MEDINEVSSSLFISVIISCYFVILPAVILPPVVIFAPSPVVWLPWAEADGNDKMPFSVIVVAATTVSAATTAKTTNIVFVDIASALQIYYIKMFS